MTSAAEAAIFGKSSGREPGPNSWQRFGRAGGLGGRVKLIGGPLAGRAELTAPRARGQIRCGGAQWPAAAALLQVGEGGLQAADRLARRGRAGWRC